MEKGSPGRVDTKSCSDEHWRAGGQLDGSLGAGHQDCAVQDAGPAFPWGAPVPGRVVDRHSSDVVAMSCFCFPVLLEWIKIFCFVLVILPNFVRLTVPFKKFFSISYQQSSLKILRM